MIGEPGCHLLNLKRQFREHKEQFEEADALLDPVLRHRHPDRALAAATTSRCIPPTTRSIWARSSASGQFRELCSACGECTLDRTGRDLPGHPLRQGPAERPLRRHHRGRQVRGEPGSRLRLVLIYEEMKERQRSTRCAPTSPPKEARLRPGQRTAGPRKEGSHEPAARPAVGQVHHHQRSRPAQGHRSLATCWRRRSSSRPLVDAINVTDIQAAAMRLGSMATCHLIKDLGGEPVLQMVTRDRNRLALQSDLLSAWVLGIENVLCLTGDHPDPGRSRTARSPSTTSTPCSSSTRRRVSTRATT